MWKLHGQKILMFWLHGNYKQINRHSPIPNFTLKGYPNTSFWFSSSKKVDIFSWKLHTLMYIFQKGLLTTIPTSGDTVGLCSMYWRNSANGEQTKGCRFRLNISWSSIFWFHPLPPHMVVGNVKFCFWTITVMFRVGIDKSRKYIPHNLQYIYISMSNKHKLWRAVC